MYRLIKMGGNIVNTTESMNIVKSSKKYFTLLLLLSFGIMFGLCGCGKKAQDDSTSQTPEIAQEQQEQGSETVDVDVSSQQEEIEVETSNSDNMVSYDLSSIGRSDPFMPYGEYIAYENATNSALREARRHNLEIAELQKLQNTKIREADDISPYSFNLPVPPTSLAGENAAAAKITKTKVVGIMYNEKSPSAIINIDDKDYLVRIGDKIINNEYKVVKINKDWITVSLGSNIYSAAIGEQFSKDDLNKFRNDLYNLKNRFGGRKG